MPRSAAWLAAAIRTLPDEELDRARSDIAQRRRAAHLSFFLEDHGVRHGDHHLARIRHALAPSAR